MQWVPSSPHVTRSTRCSIRAPASSRPGTPTGPTTGPPPPGCSTRCSAAMTSRERGRLAKTVDHRGLAHVEVGRLRILGDAAELVEAPAAHGRIALLEEGLVALALGVDMVDRDRARSEERRVGKE